MPLISVIMPAYNGEKYIASAVQSVLNQRNVDLELIVVNDGSTDRTLEILHEFSATDSRVRLINRPNSGRPAFPKNDGIAAARGNYICFLDQDDLYDSDHACQMLLGLETNPDWVATFHDSQLIDGEGNYLPDTLHSSYDFPALATPYLTPLTDDWLECSELFFIYAGLHVTAVHTQSVMIAKNRLPAGTIVFDTQYTHSDDSDLWMRLHLLGKIGYLHRVLGSYRKHTYNLTNNSESFLVDKLKLMKRNFERIGPKLSDSQLSQFKTKIANGFCDLGYMQYKKSNFREAKVAYLESLTWELKPKTLLAYGKCFIPENAMQFFKRIK